MRVLVVGTNNSNLKRDVLIARQVTDMPERIVIWAVAG